MDAAFFLLLASTVAIAVTSSIVTTWSLRARLYALEDRTNVMEGTMTREVKIRAAQERWGKKPSKEEERIAAALENPQPVLAVPWWQDPRLKKGAYVP